MKNLADYLKKYAEGCPEKLGIRYPTALSFAEMNLQVDRLCHGMAQTGIQKGAKVIVLIKADHYFYLLVFALMRMGAVPVLIDPGVGSKVMKNSLSSIQADAFIGIPKAHLLRLIYRKAFAKIPIIITLGTRWFWGGIKFEKLFVDHGGFPPAVIDADDTGGIFFTSGSTGPPKGVIYKNRMFQAQIDYFSTHFKWSSDDIDLCTFPLIGLFSLCLGVPIVIADLDPTYPARLDPAKLWKNLTDHHCSHMFGSPMILQKLATYGEQHQLHLPDVKRIVTAGAPVPIELLRRMRVRIAPDAEIHTPYGATEALPVTDAIASELIREEIKQNFETGICVGKAMPGMEIKIIPITDKPVRLGEETKAVAPNTVGEIMVKGPVVSASYYDNPQANQQAKVLDEGQEIWHRMGDLGRMDEQGHIWFYGRKNHRVVTPDHCYFTIPTEAVFNSHPDVERSALVGAQKPGDQVISPIICIEANKVLSRKSKTRIREELRTVALNHSETKAIQDFLFISVFPVDPRHNAKIFREKLQQWASRQIQ